MVVVEEAEGGEVEEGMGSFTLLEEARQEELDPDRLEWRIEQPCYQRA